MPSYAVNSQAFTFNIVGAKPYSQYIVYSDGYDLTCRIKPFGKNLGDPLLTDQTGKMTFTLFYLDVPEQTGSVKNFPTINSKTTDVQSNKIIYIIDPSGTSVIQRVIPFIGNNRSYKYDQTA